MISLHLFGYLILGIRLFKNPKKYSSAWNFGTEKNTVNSVLSIVKFAINRSNADICLICDDDVIFEKNFGSGTFLAQDIQQGSS